MSTTMNISDICKQMHAEGFKYGSITHGGALNELGASGGQLESGHYKPMKGVWFSKISKSYSDDEQEEPDCLALEWYNFVVQEDFRTDRYAKSSLLFAKFDQPRLLNNGHPSFLLGGPFRFKSDFLTLPHWNRVSAKYAGIHVDPCIREASDIFPAWDVDTVCIWDATAVTEVRWFENAGTPWTYDVLSHA